MGLKKKTVFHEFKRIQFLMLLLGFPHRKFGTTSTSCKEKSLLLYWPIFCLIFRAFMQISGVTFSYILFPRYPFLAFSTYVCQAALLGATLFIKRNALGKAMYSMQKISQRVKTNGQGLNMKIHLYITGVIALMVFYFCIFILTDPFKKSDNDRRKKFLLLTRFGLSESAWITITTVCVFLGAQISTVIYGMVFITCKAFYLALSAILKDYTRNLQFQMEAIYSKDLSKISNEIQNLHIIAGVVEKADRAINFSAFQLLAVFFSGFFSLVLAVPSMSMDSSSGILAYWFVSAVIYMSLFLMLIVSASRVREDGKILKQAAMRYSDILGGRSPDLNMVPLMIFLQNAKELDVGVTGGNMFYIEKGIFLTVGSAMVTYGVILYQMGYSGD